MTTRWLSTGKKTQGNITIAFENKRTRRTVGRRLGGGTRRTVCGSAGKRRRRWRGPLRADVAFERLDPRQDVLEQILQGIDARYGHGFRHCCWLLWAGGESDEYVQYCVGPLAAVAVILLLPSLSTRQSEEQKLRTSTAAAANKTAEDRFVCGKAK